MLREWKGVRQRPDEGYRRWFADEDMDLIVWYRERGGSVRGFQLCYGKQSVQHALTWLADRGYNHARVDDGEAGREGASKQTPMLVEDGTFDASALADRFVREAGDIDPEVRSLVSRKLRAMGGQEGK